MDAGRLGGNGVRCGANTIADGSTDSQPDRHSHGVADGCANGVSYGVAIASADGEPNCIALGGADRCTLSGSDLQSDIQSDTRVRSRPLPQHQRLLYELRLRPFQWRVQRWQLHGLRQRAVLSWCSRCMQRLRCREVPPVDRQRMSRLHRRQNHGHRQADDVLSLPVRQVPRQEGVPRVSRVQRQRLDER